MSFIRIAVAGLALCASASVAGAQGHEGHGQAKPAGSMQIRGHRMLLKGITLTADQQAKLDALAAKHHTERQAAMPDGNRPDSAARAKMRDGMQKNYAEIRDILTAEQQKVFDANVEKMKQRRESRRSTMPRT